jgi:hypothetical protein
VGTATLGYPGGPATAFRLDPELITILKSMTDTNECSIDGCHDSIRNRRLRLCSLHYQRHLKYGDPLAVKSRWDGHELVSAGSCSIDGCDDPVVALGWCSKHYQRWQAHGDPLTVKVRQREEGGSVAVRQIGPAYRPGPAPKPSDNYSTQHKQVAAARGRPQRCEHCGASGPKRTYDWAFNNVGDRKNPQDYIRLCRACHWAFDETPETLVNLAKAREIQKGYREDRKGGGE